MMSCLKHKMSSGAAVKGDVGEAGGWRDVGEKDFFISRITIILHRVSNNIGAPEK